MKTKCWSVVLGFGLTAVTGCSGGSSSSLNVLVEREDAIATGLEPGTETENIQDGWSVRFTEFVVSLSSVSVSRDGSSEVGGKPGVLVDLVALSENEESWLELTGLEAARYDFSFTMDRPSKDAEARGVSQETKDFMVQGGFTTLVRGVLEKADGRSCPPTALVSTDKSSTSANAAEVPCYDNTKITFEVTAAEPAQLGPCELDGLPGVGLGSGTTKSVAITFHGDHLFFNGFPTGEEASVVRLAQWLADSDLNLDGSVDSAELAKISPSDLSELDDRYSLSGAPVELRSMADFAEAELLTQGHFQGEGECPLTLLAD